MVCADLDTGRSLDTAPPPPRQQGSSPPLVERLLLILNEAHSIAALQDLPDHLRAPLLKQRRLQVVVYAQQKVRIRPRVLDELQREWPQAPVRELKLFFGLLVANRLEEVGVGKGRVPDA